MSEDVHDSELERAISEAETDGRAEVGDAEVGRQQFYEPRFEPLVATSCRSISEMSDGELEIYIQAYQELVHKAEQAVEAGKARLSAARLEKGERPKSSQRTAVDQAVALAAERKSLGQPAEPDQQQAKRAVPRKRRSPSGPVDRPAQETDSLLAAYWTKKRGDGKP